ncbi:MAG: TonB-dependent receptor [Halioglobus sp.]|nr:TonB-dependent receptor [Halioglobus sp.]
MNKSAIRAVIPSLVLAAGVAGSPQARAQQTLEEVLVTAQKRAENLQDVAASVTAVAGDALRDLGAYDFRELGTTLTNVTVSNDQSSVDIAIRGVSNNRGFSAPTAFHVDGIYASDGKSGLAAFLDLARVEVVRGPAGTLYGRNATAGAVNVISNRPDTQASSLAIEGSAGNDDFESIQAVGNLAINDQFALRAAYLGEERDGWSTHESFAPDVPDQATDDADLKVYKLRAAWDISETVSWLIGYEHFKSAGSGRRLLIDFEKSIARNNLENGLDNNLTEAQRTRVANDPRYVPANGVYDSDIEQDFFLSDLRVEFGGTELAYLFGYREIDEENRADTDFYMGNFITTSAKYIDEMSHELRLSGATESVRWLVGLYYWESETDDGFLQDFGRPNGLVSRFSADDASGESLGVFTQATVDLTATLRLTGGLRYSEDEQKSGTGVSGLENSSGTLMAQPYEESSGDWDDVSYKLAIEYDVAEDSLLYASISTGYKTGGLNSPSVSTTFEPEEVIAYEIGSKNLLADGRLQLNGAVFYYDYENLQISGLEVVNDQPIAAQTNIDESEIFGAELEWIALLCDGLRIDGGIGYLRAEAESGIVDDPTEQQGGLTIDISGNELRKSPEWTLNLGVQYDHDMGDLGALTGRVNFHYADEQYHDVVNVEQNLEDDFTKTDLSLTWRSPKERFFAQAFWRHIEDDEVRTTIFQTPIGALSSYAAPETYGLRVGYTFE